MTNTDSSHFNDPTLDESQIRDFENAWIRGDPGSIEQHLPDRTDGRYLPMLEVLVQIDLDFAWKSAVETRNDESATTQSPRRVEQYVARFEDLNEPTFLERRK